MPQFDVDFFDRMGTTQALGPALLRSRGGAVMMSSVGGRLAQPTDGAHSRHKCALEAVNAVVVALVAGANGGIGTELVFAALAHGAAKVYATNRVARDWDDDHVVPLTLDVTTAKSVAAPAATGVDVTVPINNGGDCPRRRACSVLRTVTFTRRRESTSSHQCVSRRLLPLT